MCAPVEELAVRPAALDMARELVAEAYTMMDVNPETALYRLVDAAGLLAVNPTAIGASADRCTGRGFYIARVTGFPEVTR